MEGDNGQREVSTIESVLANGLSHFPEFLSQTAFGAISRLVTGIVDIPAVTLAGYKERLEDRNREKRALRQSLSDAAIAKLVQDEAVVQRTVDRLVNEEFRKQKNREAVALATIKLLAESDRPSSHQDVDEDWMDCFSEKAESARSEDAQILWSRVLAGEIVTPGSFSKRSLEVLKILDRKEAEIFSKIARLSFGNVIPFHSIGTSGDKFSDARILQDLGLLSGLGGNFAKPLMHTQGSKFGGLSGRYFHIQVYSEHDVNVQVVFLTQVGSELAYLVDDDAGANELAVGKSIAASLVGKASSAMIMRKEVNGKLIEPQVIYGNMEYLPDTDSFRIDTNVNTCG